MGKRSGVPHRDDELAALSEEQVQAEIDRAKMRLRISGSAKQAKSWRQRIHWLESERCRRD